MKRIIVINALVFLFILLLAEAASWFILAHFVRSLHTDSFLQAVYKEKWEEYKITLQEQSQGIRYLPFAEYTEAARRGRFVVVNPDGRRSNSFAESPLKSGPNTIYVFGGSTVFGYGVKDDETIPAYIEKELHSRGHNDWSVHNFGAAAYYSTIERIRFVQLLLSGFVPEVAIFIDGLNDFFSADVPDQSPVAAQISIALNPSIGENISRGLVQAAQTSNTYRLLSQVIAKYITPPGSARDSDQTRLLDRGETSIKIAPAIDRLQKNREMISAIGKIFGVRTVFVQQPVPTYHYDPTKGIVPMYFFNKGIGNHVRSGSAYKIMEQQIKGNPRHTPPVLWLADLTIDEPMYVDTVHYSPRFNQKIAESILPSLVPLSER